MHRRSPVASLTSWSAPKNIPHSTTTIEATKVEFEHMDFYAIMSMKGYNQDYG